MRNVQGVSFPGYGKKTMGPNPDIVRLWTDLPHKLEHPGNPNNTTFSPLGKTNQITTKYTLHIAYKSYTSY